MTLLFNILVALLISANVSWALDRSLPPCRRPHLPDHFKVSTTFFLPLLSTLHGNLLVNSWEEGQWYFRTNAKLIAKDSFGMPEDPTVEQLAEAIANINNMLGLKEGACLYLSTDVHGKLTAWTETGAVNMESEDFNAVVGVFSIAAPGMLEAFAQWSHLQRVGPMTIKGEELMGWRAPEQVNFAEYNATFYATAEGNLQWLVQEGPQDLGALAILPTKFDSVELLDEKILQKNHEMMRRPLFWVFSVAAFGLAFIGMLHLLQRRLLLERGGNAGNTTTYQHAPRKDNLDEEEIL